MPNPMMEVEGHGDFDHLGHCIDSLRETLTCSADVTPLVWIWDEQDRRSMPRLDVVHTCRNFGKIQDWARSHTLRSHFDSTVHIEDDLEFPEFG